MGMNRSAKPAVGLAVVMLIVAHRLPDRSERAGLKAVANQHRRHLDQPARSPPSTKRPRHARSAGQAGKRF